MRIFLIIHGEKIEKFGYIYKEVVLDHKIRLTQKGIEQAYNAGIYLKKYCDEQNIDLQNSAIWRSPYLRAVQTCEEFNKSLNISKINDDVSIIEQRLGLFDYLTKEERKNKYPNEWEEYERQINNGGNFFAKLPMGEAPFDVSIRVYQFLNNIMKYYKQGINTFFVFTHSTVMKCILLRYFNYSIDWYENENDPINCCIRLIEDNTDLGYIYSGK